MWDSNSRPTEVIDCQIRNGPSLIVLTLIKCNRIASVICSLNKFNIEYVTDSQIKKSNDSFYDFYDREYHKPEIKKEENKPNIIISNDEFLI